MKRKIIIFKSIIKAGIYDILSCKNRRGIFKVKFINIKKLRKKLYNRKPNQKSISNGRYHTKFHIQQEKLIE